MIEHMPAGPKFKNDSLVTDNGISDTDKQILGEPPYIVLGTIKEGGKHTYAITRPDNAILGDKPEDTVIYDAVKKALESDTPLRKDFINSGVLEQHGIVLVPEDELAPASTH